MNDDEEIIYLLDDEDDPLVQENWNILIVDDEPDVHAVTTFTLSNLVVCEKGLAFISVYSGKEAIEVLSERKDIDLILLDCVMETETAGWEVASFVKNNISKELPVIVMRTGFAGLEIKKEKLYLSSVDDFVYKSTLTKELFVELINKWLFEVKKRTF